MKDRKSVILFVIYVVIFIVFVTYATLPEQLRTIQRSVEFQTTVDVEKTKLFDVMADVENYPLVLPESYVSVKILNKTSNSILSLETVKEAGVQATFHVRHTIIPNESHQITILDGDAKGTNIVIWFNNSDSNKTQISTKLDLRLTGIMAPFGILPENNIHHAFNTILDSFAEYVHKTESKKAK